jgi:hypothetical protein
MADEKVCDLNLWQLRAEYYSDPMASSIAPNDSVDPRSAFQDPKAIYVFLGLQIRPVGGRLKECLGNGFF